jgi:hypothetical protein
MQEHLHYHFQYCSCHIEAYYSYRLPNRTQTSIDANAVCIMSNSTNTIVQKAISLFHTSQAPAVHFFITLKVAGPHNDTVIQRYQIVTRELPAQFMQAYLQHSDYVIKKFCATKWVCTLKLHNTVQITFHFIKCAMSIVCDNMHNAELMALNSRRDWYS